jgi:hypothetical protein
MGYQVSTRVLNQEAKGMEVMRTWKSILVTLAVVALATPVLAQTGMPAIGVFFDTHATQQFASVSGGTNVYHTAYVFAVNLDQMVGGMAFALQTDPAIHLMFAEYPDAVSIGDPKDGVGIGFEVCQPGWDGNPVLGCTMTLWTGTNLVENGELRIVANPDEGGIIVSDCDGNLTYVSGLTSFMSVTVGNDETTWGAVKDLYK